MAKPGFRSSAAEKVFDEAYDRALAAWPVGTTSLDVATDLGRTRVHQVGPQDGATVLLLPGAGGTAMSWTANVEELSRDHRLIVPDVPGQAGRSVVQKEMATGAEAVLAWLDQLLDRLDVADCTVCGHSYGAWLALYHGLGSRRRRPRLVLLDPTTCFAEPSLAYRVRAVPVFARPGPKAMDAFVRWESRGRQLEELSQAVLVAGAAYRGVGTEIPRIPNHRALEELTTPILVVAAGRSRQHDPVTLVERARATGTNVSTVTVPGASHFTLPATDATAVNEAIATFVALAQG